MRAVHAVLPCCGWLVKTRHQGHTNSKKLYLHIPCGVELPSSPSPLSCWCNWHVWQDQGNLPHHNTKRTYLSKQKPIYIAYAVFLACLLRRQTKLGLCCKFNSVWSGNRAHHIFSLLLDFFFFFSPPVCRHDSLKAEVFNNSKVFQVSFFAVDKKIPLIKVLPYITVFL